MGRWTQYDEDSARLPEGMKRVGYDADTRRYTFEDGKGVLYQSEPGNSYGILTPAHQMEDTRIQRARPNAFESSTPGKQQKATRLDSNVNSFEDFLPSDAITSPSSPNPKSPLHASSSIRRLPDVLNKVRAMRTAVSQMQNSGSDATQHRRDSSPSPSPSPPPSRTSPRLTHRRRGYSQLPEVNDVSRVGEKAKGLLRSLTVSTRSSVRSSSRSSPQPRPSRSSSRASAVSKTSTITPMKTS